MSSINANEMDRVAEAAGLGNSRHDQLMGLISSPLYQIRRVLRVTQMNWQLPAGRGKRAARLAQRVPPVLGAPRPGLLAGYATQASAAGV